MHEDDDATECMYTRAVVQIPFICRLLTENICRMPLLGRSKDISSRPNETGRLFRRDFHGYEARSSIVTTLLQALYIPQKPFCVLQILSFDSGSEVSRSY